jgi:hypothetical protein
MGRLNLNFVDRDNEKGSMSLHIEDMTAGTFTAQNGLIDDVVAAIEAVTLLPLTKDSRIAIETGFAPALPSSKYAQRGIKWLVRAVDPSGNAVTFHIPGADLSLLGTGESLDLTAGVGLDLKNAIEAVIRSNDGEVLVVQEVVYID